MQWTSLLDLREGDLRSRMGEATFLRGEDYFYSNHIKTLAMDDAGTRVVASVRGSRGRNYAVTVALVGGVRLTASCSCPMRHNCKHTVAVILAAQEQLAEEARFDGFPGGPTSAKEPRLATDWRQRLDHVISLVEPPSAGLGRRLALVVEAPVNQYGGPSVVRLTPYAEGKRDNWIKTGISWQAISSGQAAQGRWDQPSFDKVQLAALTDVANAARGGQSYYYSLDRVSLDSLGAQWGTLMRAAVRSGVSLLHRAPNGEPVEVSDEAGRLAWNINPPEGGSPGVVELRVILPVSLRDRVVETDSAEQPRILEVSGGHGLVSGWAVALAGGGLALVPARDPAPMALTQLSRSQPMEIPAAEWSEFALTRLPALRHTGEVRVPEGYVLPVPQPTLLFTVTHFADHRSTVVVSWEYAAVGVAPISAPLRPTVGRPPEVFRDGEAEAAILEQVTPLLDDGWWSQRLGGRELVDTVVRRGRDVIRLGQLLDKVSRLDGVEVRVSGETRDYVEAVDGPVIEISARESGHPDWFDLGVVVRVGEEVVPLADLIAALVRRDDVMLLDSGTWFTLDRPELDQLRSILEEAQALQDKDADPNGPLRLSIVQAGLWEELVSLGVVREQSERWERAVGALTGLTPPEEIAAPTGLQATLRPYQLDGLRWLTTLWEAGLGGVLADDMGLGKTVQTLALIQRAHEAGELTDPVLIVCPTSVMSTWAREAATFTPELGVCTLGETRKRAKVPLAESIGDAQIVITSYALLRIDAKEFAGRDWSAMVLDEAQFLKNHRSQGYAAARKIPRARTFALTGTPLENSLMDLWSLLSLTAPGLYPRPDVFTELYRNPIERAGDVAQLATLRRRIRPLMLRRTKQAVATELPPRQEQVLSIALAPKHRTVYERHLARERQRILGLVADLQGNRIQILRALTMLRQLSLDPGLVDEKYADLAISAKLDVLAEQLVELASEGHRALVFSQFTSFLKLARQRLEAEGLACVYLDGTTRKRERVLEEWREGDAPAFLISLKAGGFGLTLTEADYVYVLDPWWNPAAEMQAVDRAHRIGQTKPVNVYRLVSSDTIEEKVVALQQRKRELFERVVDDGAVMTGALTADDIRGLLEG